MDLNLKLAMVRAAYFVLLGAYFLALFLAYFFRVKLKEHFSEKVVFLTTVTSIYCVMSIVLLSGPYSTDWMFVLFPVVSFLASFTYGTYLNVLSSFLNLKDSFLQLLSRLSIILSFVILSSIPGRWFLREGGTPNPNWLMNYILGSVEINNWGLVILGAGMVIPIIASVYLLSKYRERLRSESLIRYGILVTLFTTLSDNLMGLGVPYLFSLFEFGFLFEVIRFTLFTLEINLERQRVVTDHLQTTLKQKSFSRLFIQFVHDVKSLVRREPDPRLLNKRIHDLSRRFEALEVDSFQVDTSMVEGIEILTSIYDQQIRVVSGAIELSGQAIGDVLFSKADFLMVFGNLLQNSVEACDKETSLKIEVVARAKPSYFEITYTDNGSGLPPGMAQRLFAVGSSSKGEGRGLGMSIVRETLLGLGGTIRCQSGSNGVLFVITVPRAGRLTDLSLSGRDSQEPILDPL